VQLLDGAWRCWVPWQSRHRLVISIHCSPVFALPVVGKRRPYRACWQTSQGVFRSNFLWFQLVNLVTDFVVNVRCLCSCKIYIFSVYAYSHLSCNWPFFSCLLIGLGSVPKRYSGQNFEGSWNGIFYLPDTCVTQLMNVYNVQDFH